MKISIKESSLKYLAMASMFLDHFAHSLLLETSFTYIVFRNLGRLAFPIFAFFIVEGFKNTNNLKKYFFRLVLFAFLSEIPFNLMVNSSIFYPDHQNVYFTLALGLAMLAFLDHYGKKTYIRYLIIGFFGFLAVLLKSDYSLTGIIYIALIYLLDYRVDKLVTTSLLFITTPLAIVGIFLSLYGYNGQRGRQNKAFNYIFYPLHLLVIYLFSLFF